MSAPQVLREQLLKPKAVACVTACLELEREEDSILLQTLESTLRLLARRWWALTEERRELDASLERLTRQAAPILVASFGVGAPAATLLATAGDNPERLRNDAAPAALCGVGPLEASSGKVIRHRLNRDGDRQANNALWTIAMVRTRAYVERRTHESRLPKRPSAVFSVTLCANSIL
ncbi:transposase [Halomonas sp. YLB-10]|uniref:transposase n=1 Tax=Halomonas sp. YLB-10 TaxID=2483111 RepID=UPI00163AE503|nr:transposase [Halomonas sp. YLB-10]